MILPKGILENTREIYAEIASYDVVPPEKIWQYWNVYTTTFRRLVDPTAYRLENFWWHVWGSDRRYLSGPQLAKLFEEFSNGPTFVPLRSPANRYEGPSVPRAQRQGLDRSDSGPSNPSQHQGSNTSTASTKVPTPSSSRPPPPHPILKKSRGPSASGPRPTARFVDEEIQDTEKTSDGKKKAEMPPPPPPLKAPKDAVVQAIQPAPATSGAVVTPTKTVATKAAPSPVAPKPAATLPPVTEMPPPPLPPQVKREKPATSTTKTEKVTTPTRKVVASTAASGSRRRPVIPRRASSQSSAGSDREALSALSAAARQKAAAKALKPRRSSSQESGGASSSSQTSQSSGLTMKALGKRPMKPPPVKQVIAGSVPTPHAEQQDRPVVVQQAVGTQPQRRSTWDIRDTVAAREPALSRKEERRRPAPPPVAGFVADTSGGAGVRTPTMMRTRSNMEGQALVGPAVARIPQALLATTVVGTTNATAQGLFDSENVTPATSTIPAARDIPDSIMLPSRPSASALLDMQFVPTAPNPTPPIPFARSKSQLTVLLEREKARKGEGF
ncbi:hypothetical protein OQA88_6330 [Cercophora sp. LCS_1]